MIVGLGLTHLLRNFAELIESPGKHRIYWVHLGWALFVFLYLLHFWWWEFRLGHVPSWSFNVYLFISLYALLLYLLCTFTFPSVAGQYPGYREFFHARRHWFFATLALVFAVDLWDTWLKGADYFHGFGSEYVVRNLGHIVLCLVAIAVRSPVFHGAFVVFALAYQASWIARLFEFI
ncbi:MAG: hypothetical protein KIS72_09150, partial [Luteimonas sp.]|nr:hypothetical protein [Luteimonas sp.]